jgi:signal transduction histidine kinase
MLHVGNVEMPENAQAALAAIAQEALANIIRHARPSLVRMSLVEEEGAIQLTIYDDGVGFDPASIIPSWNRLGLVAMYERALILGGRLEVESEPGAGTTIRALIPLER